MAGRDTIEAGFGELVAADTLRIERLLPGPQERVWRYLTEPDLRRLWLAAGDFELVPGGRAELVFNNDGLSEGDDPAPERFADFAKEIRLDGRILDCEPIRLLAYTWGAGEDASRVRFDLAEADGAVRLTVTHSRLVRRGMRVLVSAGWHTHLDLLADRLAERRPEGFWRRFVALEAAYQDRIPPV